MRKGIILFLVFCIVIISGCSSNILSKKETTELTLYTYNQDPEVAKAVINVLEQFNKEHPEIKVNLIRNAPNQPSVVGLLKQLEESDKQVDLLWLSSYMGIGEAVAGKYVQSLEQHSDSLKLNDFYVDLESQRYNDELYTVPFLLNNTLIYYNKDLFDKYQIQYPTEDWTYEDLVNMAAGLTSVQDKVVGLLNGGFLYYSVPGAYGGNTLNEDENGIQLAIAEEDALEGIEFLTNAFRNNKIDGRLGETYSERAVTVPSFENGTAAMMVNSSRFLNMQYEKVPNYGVAPLPKGPSSQQGISFIESLGISSKSEHPEEALEVLRYLTTDTAARELLVRSGVTLPTTSDEKVFDAFEKRFADSGDFETVQGALNKSNEVTSGPGLVTSVPGLNNVIIKLERLFYEQMYAGKMKVDGEFEAQIKQINDEWLIEQQTANESFE
ncbi:ABC-type glycerol-3-phosphate transport system, substrate-binding protein [Fontibacillus panacisegetis]|uniref:ABC-type glycerol-3-phosphate transport system, substrate-binding protein n=1 Tax=Fontibacillus panacisegetis TaxID=670482 RepID=A0A1G7TGP1_9BACL|nr:extracellular solute-binding protein [Fontibacillus panacisegetis]SDG34415.1 ABC-type glycerol-3-phosphate transport system, substrate-binding protein [Fontibacillus panacisegetis]